MKSNPTNRFFRSAARLLTVIFAGCAMSIHAHAATFTWDADGAAPANDGTGSWNPTGGSNWFNGSTYGAWGNTTADTATFGVANGAAGTITVGTVNANTLTFNAPGSGNYTLSGGTLTLGGTSPTINANTNARIDSTISHTNGDTYVRGAGTLTLGGASTFTGGAFDWVGGLNRYVPAGSTGATAAIAVVAGANITAKNFSLMQDNAANCNINYDQTGGTVNVTSIAASNFGLGGSTTGGSSGTNTATISGGTLTASVVSLYKWATCNLNVSNAGVVNATSLRIGWGDSSPTGTINVGDGTTFSGGTSILDGGSSGILKVNAWDVRSNRIYTLNFKGGTLKAGAGGTDWLPTNTFSTTAGANVQEAGGIIDNGGFGITIAQALKHGGVAATDGGLVFKGSGSTTLTGTNSYTGTTTVNAGSLYLTTAFTGAANPVTVNGGTFGGTVAVGNVTVNNGGSIEGGKGGTGTLTVANLIIGSLATDTATLKGTLSTAAGYKPLAVTNLILNGGDDTVTLDASGVGLVSGNTYDVLVSTNAITAPNATGTLPINVFRSNSRAYTPTVDITGTKVQLYYDSAASIYWTGAASTAWDTAATNFKLSGNNAATEFLANDVVFFNDNPTTSTVDITGAHVSPNSTIFANTTATSYTLSGTHGINTGSITKNNNGTVTISNSNPTTGAVNLNGGTVSISLSDGLGSGALGFDGGTLQYTGTSSTWTRNLSVNSGGGIIDVQSAGTTLTASLGQTLTGSLTKTGAGNPTLGAAGTGAGGVVLSAGQVTLGNTSAAGTGTITLGDANTADSNIQLTLNAANIANNITVANEGTGTVTLYATSQYQANAGTTTIARDTIFQTYDAGGGDWWFGWGPITGTGNVTFKAGAAANQSRTLLSNANSYVGKTTIAQGRIQVQGAGVFGNSSNELNLAGTGQVNLRSNASIGALTGGANGVYADVASTLTLGNGDASGTFTGYLFNAAAVLSVTKTGSGTQELSGTNITYTGATTLNNGTLKLTKTTAFNSNVAMAATDSPTLQLNLPAETDSWTFAKQITGGSANAKIEKTGLGALILTPAASSSFIGNTTAAITVTGGKLYLNNANFTTPPAVAVANSATFGGRGTAGAIAVANGGSLEGGMAGTGTLTAGIATLGGSAGDSATIKGTLATGYTPISVSNLTLNGGDQSVTLDAVGLGLSPATPYDLLVSATPITAPNSTNVLATLKSSARAYTPVIDVTGTKIQLTYDANTSVYWVGSSEDGGDKWNTTATLWKLTGDNSDTEFKSNDVVFFNDNPAVDWVFIEDGDVSPLAVTFTNSSATNYTIDGINGIATGSITKTGNGTVTLVNNNPTPGAIALNGGTVAISQPGGLGSGAISFDGGTLKYTGSNISWTRALTVNAGGGTLGVDSADTTLISTGSLTGAGTLTKSGVGTLALNTANAGFTGTTTVSQGTLTLGNTGAVGAGTITLGDANTDANPVQLVANVGSGTFSNPITVSASGSGTVTISQPQAFSNLTGLLTFNRATTLTQSGDRSAISAKITGTVGTLTFGSGRITMEHTLANASDFTGNVVINGQVQMNTAYGLPSTASVTVNSVGYFRTIAGSVIDGLNGSGYVNNNSGGGAMTTPLSLGNNGGSGSFSGTLQNGSGSDIMHITKNGVGTQTFSGNNLTYTGATLVNGGTLLIDGSKSGAGVVTVKANATLGGIGSVSGATSVEANGKVAPGNLATPINTLTLASLTLDGNYQCDLDASSSDQLAVTGALAVTATATVTFSGSPTASEYIIATYGSLVGTLPTITPPAGYTLDTATTGVIKLVKSAGYDSWMSAWALAGFTGDSTPGGDADNDGMKNLLEYVLNGNPGSSDLGILPTQQVTATNFVFTFTRRADSATAPNQIFEYGSNLTDWTPVNITGTPGAEVSIGEAYGTAPNQVQDVTVTIPRNSATKIFGRLEVSQP